MNDKMILPAGQHIFLVGLPEAVHTPYCNCHHDIPESLRWVMIGTTPETGGQDQATLDSIDGLSIQNFTTAGPAEAPFPYFSSLPQFMKSVLNIELVTTS